MVFSKKREVSALVDQRKKMVKHQLEGRGIQDSKLLKVMASIPREKFIPSDKLDRAYFDGPLPIGQGQTISQPYVVALMTQLLELRGEEKVLEIGTGSGYQAAILANLAQKVYTVERHRILLKKAKKVFSELGFKNIQTRLGDGAKGWPEQMPFEAIIVTAAASRPPQALIDQLAEGGRLVVPVGSGYWQELIRITKKNDQLIKENFGTCAFVPLISD